MVEIFKNIKEYADELDHEAEMIKLGKQRVNKRRVSHIQREEESVTSYGKVMVANTIRPLAQAIQTYLESNAEANDESNTQNELQSLIDLSVCDKLSLNSFKRIL